LKPLGADLSSWQGKVDFQKLNSKVSFVYIRAGVGQPIEIRLAMRSGRAAGRLIFRSGCIGV